MIISNIEKDGKTLKTLIRWDDDVKGDVVIPDCVTAIGGSHWDGPIVPGYADDDDDYDHLVPGAFENCQSLTSIKIPNSVLEIGNKAFAGCSNLTSIELSSTVKMIGKDAFADCPNLKKIVLSAGPDGTITSCCPNIQDGQVIIADGVTTIPERAFYKRILLTSIEIPDSVVEIGDEAFLGCDCIFQPLHNSRVFARLPYNYKGKYSIPEGIAIIAGSAFYGCEFKSVVIPDSVTEIGCSAFSRCKRLESVEIPESVKKIGDKAFYGCRHLNSIKIPDSVTEIGDDAFGCCNLLQPITKPKKVTSQTNEKQAVELLKLGAIRGYNSDKYRGYVSIGSKAVLKFKFVSGKGLADERYGLELYFDDGEYYAKSKRCVRSYLLDAAKNGNPIAQYNMGVCCYLDVDTDFSGVNNEGVVGMWGNSYGTYSDYLKKQFEEAKEWFSKAAKQGLAIAKNDLGVCYKDKPNEAFKLFSLAAEQGCAEAQYNLGICHYFGKGVTKSYEEAFFWFLKAAKQGFAEALYNLQLCYYNGCGTEQSQKNARYCFLTAELHDREGRKPLFSTSEWDGLRSFEKNNAGFLFERGLDFYKGLLLCERNYEKALECFQKSADGGNANAMFYLGVMYLKGVGVELDYKKAFLWFRKAAALNDEKSMNNIGYFYDKGLCVEKDPKVAFEWYMKAAKLGNATSQYNVGLMYRDGYGVEQNYEEAVRWFRLLAKEDADAQYELGHCYRLGRGVKQNESYAVEWYRRAAKNGHKMGPVKDWIMCYLDHHPKEHFSFQPNDTPCGDGSLYRVCGEHTNNEEDKPVEEKTPVDEMAHDEKKEEKTELGRAKGIVTKEDKKRNVKAVLMSFVALVLSWPVGIISIMYCVKMKKAYNDGNVVMAKIYYEMIVKLFLLMLVAVVVIVGGIFAYIYLA